jgi:hypothetical protein
MNIDPIYAGPVALAQGFALATRATTRQHRSDLATADPVQLMLWSECAGRPYATALGGLLVMNYFRRIIAGRRHKCADPR